MPRVASDKPTSVPGLSQRHLWVPGEPRARPSAEELECRAAASLRAVRGPLPAAPTVNAGPQVVVPVMTPSGAAQPCARPTKSAAQAMRVEPEADQQGLRVVEGLRACRATPLCH
jgi:hypothetical protein